MIIKQLSIFSYIFLDLNESLLGLVSLPDFIDDLKNNKFAVITKKKSKWYLEPIDISCYSDWNVTYFAHPIWLSKICHYVRKELAR